MVTLMTMSLSSQELDCSKINKEYQEQLHRCHDALNQIGDKCIKQLKKDAETIKNQEKIIQGLEKQQGKDAIKHRAQGAGGAAIFFILLIIFL